MLAKKNILCFRIIVEVSTFSLVEDEYTFFKL